MAFFWTGRLRRRKYPAAGTLSTARRRSAACCAYDGAGAGVGRGASRPDGYDQAFVAHQVAVLVHDDAGWAKGYDPIIETAFGPALFLVQG